MSKKPAGEARVRPRNRDEMPIGRGRGMPGTGYFVSDQRLLSGGAFSRQLAEGAAPARPVKMPSNLLYCTVILCGMYSDPLSARSNTMQRRDFGESKALSGGPGGQCAAMGGEAGVRSETITLYLGLYLGGLEAALGQCSCTAKAECHRYLVREQAIAPEKMRNHDTHTHTTVDNKKAMFADGATGFQGSLRRYVAAYLQHITAAINGSASTLAVRWLARLHSRQRQHESPGPLIEAQKPPK